ncbi:MAG: phage tail assembly protein [Candidatus Methylomirabilales bacterium]
MSTIIQTEFPFALPRGYVDSEGTLHRMGVMRLATAADEILPLKDPRVQANSGYLVVIVLSRVITRLGGLPDVSPRVVEGLFASDLAYLQDLYNRIDSDGAATVKAVCPKCEHTFDAEVNSLGGD